MVDSISRSPSPVNTTGRASPTHTQAGQLSQGSASRSQSPGASSLVSSGRNARTIPDVQQGSAPNPRPGTPYAAEQLPAGQGTPGVRPVPMIHDLTEEFDTPLSPEQALHAWAQQRDIGPGENRRLARDWINTATNTGSPNIDLANLGLTSLPHRVGQLMPNVHTLALEGNRLQSLAALAGMHSLTSLDINGNLLSSLDSLRGLRSLQIMTAYENPLLEPDNRLLSRMPALTQVFPEDVLSEGQQQALRQQMVDINARELAAVAEEDDDAGSVATVLINREDRADYQTPINEAASRWRDHRPMERAEDQAMKFYGSVMPMALHAQLQADPASRGLLTLAAGMVFTVDNDPDIERSLDAPPSASKATLIGDLEYLLKVGDATLLADCQDTADEAVNHCGDRVSYGATQLHQVIEAHRFKTGQLSAKALFEGKARHFNQSLVEAKAEDIAGTGISSESIEYYQDLAAKVIAKGRPLVETATDSLYGHLYRVTKEELQHTLDLIDTKHNNPAYLDTFKEHEATVNEVLRSVFASDYARMLEERSALEDKETDAMLDPAKSAAEQFEAGVRLGELGQRESQWYAAKLPELLEKPELLGMLG